MTKDLLVQGKNKLQTRQPIVYEAAFLFLMNMKTKAFLTERNFTKYGEDWMNILVFVDNPQTKCGFSSYFPTVEQKTF